MENQPFKLMVSKLSNEPIHLLKRIFVAREAEVPPRIVTFPTDEKIDSVIAIHHYKEKEDEKTNLDRYREVNDAENTSLKKDWKEKIIFNKAYEEYRNSFLKMMYEF